ncbi:MAG TPA: penicillin acylase family protein [Microbacterium sp.]|uniref:penicillin acylase family protein n=1 Tax=Microbacterium sp. TaxID=51671 RepID=UPI002C4626EE|nr:penicillin acylase family protein [Microbacterium sp.]HWI31498.1 penicillin acylase family protein [Microbacterium sp.]
MTKQDIAPTPVADPEPAPRKGRAGRIIGRALFGIVAGAVVIALVVAGFVVWTIQRSFPTVSGEATLSGLHNAVSVQRDELGIPTITADSTHDLFAAQGYVHAQDRFWEMDFRRHVTSGRVSELFGESQLGTDSFLRTLGWRVVAEQEVAAMDPVVLGYYEAYAEGVNAYLADHAGADLSLEYAVLGLQNSGYEPEPWEPADSVAWLKAMAWDLRSNIEDETTRALLAQSFTPAQLAELYPGYPFQRNPVIVPTLTGVAAASADAQPLNTQQADTQRLNTPPLNTQRADTPQADTQRLAAESDVVASGVQWREVSDVVAAASVLLGGAGEGIGSNSWVVSGDLTDTGMPLLSNDPHLGASMPSVWHQVQLRCSTQTEECPFDVAGFGFSGVPGVIIGHNDRVAWGFTNLTTDVTDLYIEKVEGDHYWRDGQLVPLDIRTETVAVAGGDDVELEIRATVHGPVVSGLTGDFTSIADDPYLTDPTAEVAAPTGDPAGEYAVSLQWTALQPGTTAEAIFQLNLARSWEDFRAAAELFDVPAQNLIYADIDGNIGYQTPGRLPIRGAGDGWMPQPGWDSAYDWRGFIHFAELPTMLNPNAGYIVTANNAIVDDSYPYFLSRDWDQGYRAARIVDLIERKAAAGPLTADDMRAIQADNEFWMGKRLCAALKDIEIESKGARHAVALIRSWDAQNAADSAAAAYANVYWNTLVGAMFLERDEPAPVSGQGRLFTVVDALLDDPDSPWWTNDALGVTGRDEMLAYAATAAYDELVSRQGANAAKWNWGDLHTITLTSETFGASGIAPIEALFNRGPFPVGGGSSVANATGWDIGQGYETVTVPSMRMVIDLSDFDRSTWNHLTGTSGHAYHPNYFDQTENWRHAAQTGWAFTGDAVAASTTDTLRLVPAE